MIDEIRLKDKGFLGKWIEERSNDPIKNITLERQIYAFFLLEKLQITNVEFIFKGGTALILLLDETKRFSTDIDILISKPNMIKLEELFASFINKNEIFTRYERDERIDSKFPKAHYKFFFNSIYKDDDQDGYILLDVVFEENPYLELETKEIKSSVLFTVEPYKRVTLPSITDIMIDKLTAFAPNTIGVKFERTIENGSLRDHSREVIKQWFDVSELYQKCSNFENLNARYIKLSDFEIKQREIDANYTNCLADTLNIVLCYLFGEQRNPEIYEKIKKGIRRLNSFVNIELNGSYFISASVNVIELISKVLCINEKQYQELFESSKAKYTYEEFLKKKDFKTIVSRVRVNNSSDRDRFIKSLRVISEFIDF